MDDIHKNTEEHNPNNQRKILIVFNDMIADMASNKKFNPIVTELFIRERKPNIFLVFIAISFHSSKTYYTKFNTQWKFRTKENFNKLPLIILQMLTFKTFWILTKSVLQNHILFLVIDTNLKSDNPLRFAKNLVEKI